jgi:type I restriction enzyme S subunit
VVEAAQRHLSVVDWLTESLEAEHARLPRLRQAVLKWGLEGKLIDQDANDEPAEKLLARIRAERAAAPGKKANGRRTGAA